MLEQLNTRMEPGICFTEFKRAAALWVGSPKEVNLTVGLLSKSCAIAAPDPSWVGFLQTLDLQEECKHLVDGSICLEHMVDVLHDQLHFRQLCRHYKLYADVSEKLHTALTELRNDRIMVWRMFVSGRNRSPNDGWQGPSDRPFGRWEWVVGMCSMVCALWWVCVAFTFSGCLWAVILSFVLSTANSMLAENRPKPRSGRPRGCNGAFLEFRLFW